MKYVGYGLLGLIGALLVLTALNEYQVITLFPFMGERRGTFLVPVVLIGGPLAGMLLATKQQANHHVARVLLTCIIDTVCLPDPNELMVRHVATRRTASG